MDITYAVERIKGIQRQKEQIEASLDFFDQGYVVEQGKKHRVRLQTGMQEKELSAENEEGIRNPSRQVVLVQLNNDLVKQLLAQELAALDAELELLSPVIEAANNMAREALNSINAHKT